jgi:hydroxymethylglutaryl-CoA reductase
LTNYEVTDDGHLAGSIELPLAIGTVGGATRVHPVAQTCLKIMGVNKSHELAAIVASAGLAQNVAALRALCSEGIQKGHMKLHAINLAKSVEGITDEEVGLVVDQMIKEEKIRADRAVAILKEMRDN